MQPNEMEMEQSECYQIAKITLYLGYISLSIGFSAIFFYIYKE